MEEENRTLAQNASLHYWLRLKAQQCREAGVTVQMAFEKTMELEMTEEIMKTIWHTVQKPLLKKKSTTELNKSDGEIDLVLEHINRFFAEEFNLEGLPLPHDPLKEKAPTVDEVPIWHKNDKIK